MPQTEDMTDSPHATQLSTQELPARMASKMAKLVTAAGFACNCSDLFCSSCALDAAVAVTATEAPTDELLLAAAP
jgi:hypothetical protein